MFQFPSQLSSKYDELLQQVPEAERMFNEFMHVEPTDFSDVKQGASELHLTVGQVNETIAVLSNDVDDFRKIFGHDNGNARIFLQTKLDDIIKYASSSVDEQSLDGILRKRIGDKAKETKRLDADFFRTFKEATRVFCNEESTESDLDDEEEDEEDETYGVPEELIALALQVGVTASELSGMKYYYQSGTDEKNFDTLFLEHFGGSYENIDFETLTEKISDFCRQETKAEEFFTGVENNDLRRMQIDERDLHSWRLEYKRKRDLLLRNSTSIHNTRNDIRTLLWTVLRTIESIGFWVPDHEIRTEKHSIVEFLQAAEPALRQRFNKATVSNSTFELVIPESDTIVSMHRGTVGTLLLNIVANAGKHGKATRLRINSAKGPQDLQLIIEDNGSGFDDDVARKMFTMGFSDGDSTGIGLGDADTRMAKIGGSIHPEGHSGLHSTLVSNGAKFTLTLACD